MDTSLWIWLVVALAIFWLVGLYNRLMRIRARALEVLAALERQVKSCAALFSGYDTGAPDKAAAGAVSPVDLPERWLDLLHAARKLESGWVPASGKHALSVSAQRARTETWSALQHAWDLWAQTPPDLAGPLVPESMCAEWEQLQQKAKAIQDALNLIIDNYNDSVREYPARWVVPMLGFEPSATL